MCPQLLDALMTEWFSEVFPQNMETLKKEVREVLLWGHVVSDHHHAPSGHTPVLPKTYTWIELHRTTFWLDPLDWDVKWISTTDLLCLVTWPFIFTSMWSQRHKCVQDPKTKLLTQNCWMRAAGKLLGGWNLSFYWVQQPARKCGFRRWMGWRTDGWMEKDFLFCVVLLHWTFLICKQNISWVIFT